ncbi:MAG: hypothetical protein COW02_13785 [Comamonadaceae bacterium CG12_big_fil_rev_8_21_14_0_65_59_15]|nr:MAG: hypothetical protein COW02_13785 [Comamonadaceae bacterium CG12_big_fil_rev_8_21_14_0_65_59_15]
MQTLLEAASHIAQEIERTRQRLTNLEQALDGLKPLISFESSATALPPFVKSSPSQAVDDVFIVMPVESDVAVVQPKTTIKAKSSKAKPPKIAVSAKVEVKPTRSAKPAKSAQPVEIPSTGGKFWLSCLGRKKLTTNELIDTAVVKLGLDESARVVIANRARAWLNAAAKAGVVVSSGERDGLKVFGKAVAK